jgi:hypothetical protein
MGNVDKDKGQGYLTNKMNAPSTSKQFISDNDYYGTAQSSDKKQVSYDDVYNATINDVKETLLKGRSPTQNNTKIAVGGDKLNVDLRMDSCEYQTNQNLERVREQPVHVDSINLTTDKITLDEQVEDRLNSDILKAFHENPYTKSLTDTI